eukprot:scaffold2553_cov32-Attheya_sp.AAC.6
MRMRSGLVCCRQRPAWVNWVVVLLLLSDLGPLSCRAQANELLLNENVEFKRQRGDRRSKRRSRSRTRTRNRKERDSPTTDVDPPEEEDLLVNTGPKSYLDLERGGRLEKYRLRKNDRKFQ